MATNKEFELITGMYLSAIGKANSKIRETIKEGQEKYGHKEGNALSGLFERYLKEATEEIRPLETEADEFGFTELLKDENGLLIYDKKDALKMLQAIEIINTHIL